MLIKDESDTGIDTLEFEKAYSGRWLALTGQRVTGIPIRTESHRRGDDMAKADYARWRRAVNMGIRRSA